MRNRIARIVALLVLAVCATAALAAPKHAHKKVAKHPAPGVRGVAQLAGDNGKIGQAYTLGKGRDAITFTLLRAEYSVERIALKDSVSVPPANQKFLVLHYTLHNSSPRDYTVNGFTLVFTAVDSHDVNHSSNPAPFMKDPTLETDQITLKPAQKLAVMTTISVPNDASVPKLIVQLGDAVPVERIYFKPGDIKPVPAPWADPNDKTGCTALSEAAIGPGVYAQEPEFDVKFVSGSYAPKVGDNEAREGEQFYVATLTIRNATRYPRNLIDYTFCESVKTDDGAKTPIDSHPIVGAQRDTKADTTMDPGDEYTFRVLVPIPTGAKVTQLRLRSYDETSRMIDFNVGG